MEPPPEPKPVRAASAPTTPSSSLPHRLASLAASALRNFRLLLGLLLIGLFSPLLAACLAPRRPPRPFSRPLEYLAARTLALIACLAGVSAAIAPSRRALHPSARALRWLAPPLVRRCRWPTARAVCVHTYDQPGRWMSDPQLSQLARELAAVASASLDAPLVHRLFCEDARAAYGNRVVSVAYAHDGTPVGFAALAYLPVDGRFLVHLGLTMICRSARGQRLQSGLFTKCLTLATLNQWRFAYTVTNIGGSPAGIGSVADYFDGVFPHYAGAVARTEGHLEVARHLLGGYRHEFGCSGLASFDEETFVVRGSNQEEGGGAAALIKEDGKPVSRHRNPVCNEFCMQRLDLARGDEFLQVGRFNAVSSILKYVRLGSIFSQGKKTK